MKESYQICMVSVGRLGDSTPVSRIGSLVHVGIGRVGRNLLVGRWF